jgi:hypothetical protein
MLRTSHALGYGKMRKRCPKIQEEVLVSKDRGANV